MSTIIRARWERAFAKLQECIEREKKLLGKPEEDQATEDRANAAYDLIDRTLAPDGEALIFKLNLLEEMLIGIPNAETFAALRSDAKLLRAQNNVDELWARAEADLAEAEAAIKALPSDTPDEVTDAHADRVTEAQVFLTRLPATTMRQALRRIEIGVYDGELQGVDVNELIDEAKQLL